MAIWHSPPTFRPLLSHIYLAEPQPNVTRLWHWAGNKKLKKSRNFLNWLCLLNAYCEIFLGQLLPMSVSLKLTHSASDLKQSVHTWNPTCFSSSPIPCRDKTISPAAELKIQSLLSKFAFHCFWDVLRSNLLAKVVLQLSKIKLFLWFLPPSFLSLMQTEICHNSSLCNPQKT